VNVLRIGVGDPADAFVRTETFFLIDKGSVLEGTAPLAECFGVTSVLPVG
jgi:hypothetical protein